MRILPLLLAVPLLASCQATNPDPRGVEKGETLLTIAATGRAEARPDEARLRMGVVSVGPSASEASRLNREKMAKVTAALTRLGVKPDDLQTQQLTLERIEYGRERGQYRASNVLEARLTAMNRVGEAVTAVTEAGANLLGGPDLRVSDREAANRSAYANAFKAARSRAEAYGEAAGLKIVRVVNIVDGGEYGGPVPPPYLRTQGMDANAVAQVSAPPPTEQGAPFNPGLNRTEVRVRVDFALEPA
ncbi:SIMPL domain-containing protein [Sphingomonas sp. GCM10030256]|uniref:SIMPL domain-containing protein n=1 Tax=Sphingomonas sp. GCM10030256 TaxID=3273427 RepID=UPI00360A6980